MKLLVLAQVPPPVHGQNLMVEQLLKALPKEGIEVTHIPLQLSRSQEDIGSLRLGKIRNTISAGFRVRSAVRLGRFDGIYYVPAPGKRAAAWRDIVLMTMVRRLFPSLILHWHSTGLSDWMKNQATWLEKAALRRAFGQAELSIILGESLSADARAFNSKRIAIVPNGVEDPGPHKSRMGSSQKVLFLGQCSEAKGLFAAMDAIEAANSGGKNCQLIVAGSFSSQTDQDRFRNRVAEFPERYIYEGQVGSERKAQLFDEAACLCFPTHYPHEGQPLVIIEAFAHGVPVISTRWRGIPEMVSPGLGLLSTPGNQRELNANLSAILDAAPEREKIRRHFLSNYSAEQHVKKLAATLRMLSVADAKSAVPLNSNS